LNATIEEEELPGQPLIWRDTMDEGFIAVRNYSLDVKELRTA
jgi:hypothetical protein